jgi:hypothetical protein
VADAQDGNRYTGAEFSSGQAWLQVVLDRPYAVSQAAVTPVGASCEWSLDAADSAADLQAGKRTFQRLVGPRPSEPENGSLATFPKPRSFRAYRLTLRATTPGARPRLGEWNLWTEQRLARVRLESFSAEMAVGGTLPLRADGTCDAGARQNVTPDAQWIIEPPSRGTVDAFSRFVAAEPGSVRISAAHQGVRSAPLELNVLPQGRPDWCVTFIERQPRFPRDGTSRLTPGQTIQWFAHVKNYGTADAGPVGAEWRVDGKPVRTFRFGKLGRFQRMELILGTKWDGQRHRIELVVDPAGEIEETCEGNNTVAVDSDAHPVGFWVEDGLLRYFHRHQAELKAGSNSWEDWAQRQVTAWNRWIDRTSWLWVDSTQTPDRWRLDRIIEVGDGMLPMSGGTVFEQPDTRDQTVALACGFSARELLGTRYRRTAALEPDNPFHVDPTLVRALARTRFVKGTE